MKKVSLSLLFIALFFTAFSQDAKTILDKLAEKSKSSKTMKGTFEYNLENKTANIHENSKGSFLIKGDKYFVDVLGAETYYDGDNLYSYIKEVNEVTIQKPEADSEDFLKPSNLFTIYQTGYDCKYVGKIIENGKSIHVIDLLPKDDDKNYKKLIVKVDKKTNQLVSMKSIGESGDDVEIKVISMQENVPADDNKFTFNKAAHPDVEVVDMR